MSRRLQNKVTKCMICNRRIELQQTFIPVMDIIFEDVYDIPKERYVNINCPCLSIYNENTELIGLSKAFVMEYGEA